MTRQRIATPAERIAAATRGGPPITDTDRAAAVALCTDMLAAAARHGITHEDLAWVTGLPDACLDVILLKRDNPV